MKLSRPLAAASLAMLAGCMTTDPGVAEPATAGAPAAGQPAATADRFVHTIDVASTVRPYLSPQGFLDPEFPVAIAEPSPVLTDFFGMQAIADVPRARIIADFVPALAELVSQDAHSVTLRFRGGYNGTFYPNASIAVMTASAPYSHVAISGDDWRAIRAHLADFLATLRTNGLGERYLIANPFYRDEVATAAQMRGGRRAQVVTDPDASTFLRTPDAILLKPEPVHGQRGSADELMALLRRGGIDWIGLEMLPVTMQDELDAFYRARPGTDAYAQARQTLVDYFADAWNGRAGPRTTGEENYYFQLVETARANGARVIALEEATIPYILLRYGETPFGGSVRSYQWAKSIPAQGRGVIFGGSSHFDLPPPTNVQDFIALRQPDRRFLSLQALRARPQS